MAWDQILAMKRDIETQVKAELSQPPVECPNDYTALKQGPNGTLFCPWDGWVWPDDPGAHS